MFYNKIEYLRKERKIIQRDFAEMIGITREHYGRMIKEKTMKVSTLEKIAKVLNVPVTYFFTDNQEPLNQVSEPSTPYGTNDPSITNKLLEEIFNELKEQLKQKDDQIKFLQHIIEEKLRQ